MKGLILKIILSVKNDGYISIFIKLYRRVRVLFSKIIYKIPIKKGWKKLINSFEGKTVYLIGNGPSLNKMPFFLLK
ncbi:MAG: hypothetical protein ACI863_000089 [Flavobacteriales bacterium]|jgi:hypothetical protein